MIYLVFVFCQKTVWLMPVKPYVPNEPSVFKWIAQIARPVVSEKQYRGFSPYLLYPHYLNRAITLCDRLRTAPAYRA